MPLLCVLLPALGAALFLYAAGVCLYGLLRRAPSGPAPAAEWPAAAALRRAALATLAAGAVYEAAFLAAARLNMPGQPLAAALQGQFFGNTDAAHYIALAEYGYGSGEAFPEQYLMIVFFPLFPALLRALTLGVFPYWAAALAVQPLLACLAGMGLYALSCRWLGAANARWALLFWLVSPGAAFFWAPMTESLFLALAAWYTVALERRRWGACMALGLLAGLTRAPGMLLSGLAAVWLWQEGRRQRRWPGIAALAAALAPALGLGLYFLLNLVVYGNWQQYAIYQREHWNNALGLFTDTIRYHLEYTAAWWSEAPAQAVWLCLTAVLCILAALLLLALAARRLPIHHLAYGLAYTAVTTGVTWLISAPRYAAALFCLPMALAACTRRRPRLRLALAALLTLCGALYTWQYLSHGPIY